MKVDAEIRDTRDWLRVNHELIYEDNIRQLEELLSCRDPDLNVASYCLSDLSVWYGAKATIGLIDGESGAWHTLNLSLACGLLSLHCDSTVLRSAGRKAVSSLSWSNIALLLFHLSALPSYSPEFRRFVDSSFDRTQPAYSDGSKWFFDMAARVFFQDRLSMAASSPKDLYGNSLYRSYADALVNYKDCSESLGRIGQMRLDILDRQDCPFPFTPYRLVAVEVIAIADCPVNSLVESDLFNLPIYLDWKSKCPPLNTGIVHCDARISRTLRKFFSV